MLRAKLTLDWQITNIHIIYIYIINISSERNHGHNIHLVTKGIVLCLCSGRVRNQCYLMLSSARITVNLVLDIIIVPWPGLQAEYSESVCRELEGRGACREVGDKVYKCLVISHQGAVTSVSIECVCLHREVLSTELPTQLQCALFMCWVCTLRRLKSDPVNGNIYWRFSFTLWC